MAIIDKFGWVVVWLALWGVLLIANGLWLVLRPARAWWLRHSFSFRNPHTVEPSTTVLVYYRASGIFAIALGSGLLVWLGVLVARR